MVIAAQPMFIVALVCGMLGYGVMALAMTATPLAMHHYAYPFSKTSFVVQWHVLGMFAPAFFTGHLIKRYGVLNIMLAGGILGVACVAVNLAGSSVAHFWAALLFLGISWNFLFIGATTLLTETYRPEERAKVQALNDFCVFTTVALASLSAGALQNSYGWQVVNFGLIPLLIIIMVSIIWGKSRHDTVTVS
jgi:MFS family permease